MVLTSRISLQDWQRHATAHPMIGGVDKSRAHIEHPVCPRCEKIALRGNGKKGSWTKDRIATCPSCGYQGKTTLLVKEYLEEGLHRR